MRWYNSDAQTDSLIILPTSKASACQRAGRAGRTRMGKVYRYIRIANFEMNNNIIIHIDFRLYREEDFAKLPARVPPEITRSNLSYVVLQLKALGIANIIKFEFPSPPPIQNLKNALEILYALDAIDINGELTKPLGFNMAEFALDPIYSKILLSSGTRTASLIRLKRNI